MAEPAFRAWNRTESDTNLDAGSTAKIQVFFRRKKCHAESEAPSCGIGGLVSRYSGYTVSTVSNN
jgi:hypothetical protein